MMLSVRRMWRIHLVMCAWIILSCLATPALSADTAANPFKDQVVTREERVLGLTKVYATVRQHSAYLDRITEAGWDKAYMEYLPQVEKKQSLYDYYRVLQRLIALIQDGHTNVYFPQSVQAELDRLPIRVEIVEGKWVVTDRVPTEEILKEDIPPGTVVESIEGLTPGEYFKRELFPYIAAGREQAKIECLSWLWAYPKGAKVKMSLRYPDGSSHERVLKANRKTTKWTDELHAKYTLGRRYGPGFASSEPEPGITCIAFRSCDSESEGKVVELLKSLSSSGSKGVILDLRANGGGSTPGDCFRHLISKPAKWYECKSRWSLSYMDAQTRGSSEEDAAKWVKDHGLPEQLVPGWCNMTWGAGSIEPADTHYDGPLVVLTGPATASAAEDLVVLLQQAGRGKVVGDRTFGSTGQPIFFDLPGGGNGRVCTIRARCADGREFIDVGCKPDVLATPTINGIASGRDEVLEKGIEVLKGLMAGNQAH